MDKLHFSIVIHAPKEKVWNIMLDKDSYQSWVDVFRPGSHYVGDWNKGSKILFLAPDESGEMAGMVSRIAENRPYEFISIEHLGMINNGIEDTSSEEVKGWAGAHENYTFKETGGSTNLLIEMDTDDNFTEMFKEIWPKALQKVKVLAEKQVN